MTLKTKLKDYGINLQSKEATDLTGVSAESFSQWLKKPQKAKTIHVLMMGLKAIQDAEKLKLGTFEDYVRYSTFAVGTRITLPNGQLFECVKPEPVEARCPNTIDAFEKEDK